MPGLDFSPKTSRHEKAFNALRPERHRQMAPGRERAPASHLLIYFLRFKTPQPFVFRLTRFPSHLLHISWSAFKSIAADVFNWLEFALCPSGLAQVAFPSSKWRSAAPFAPKVIKAIGEDESKLIIIKPEPYFISSFSYFMACFLPQEELSY